VGDFLGEVVEVLGAEGEVEPAVGAEGVNGERERRALDVFENERFIKGGGRFGDAVGNFGDFEDWMDGSFDALELALGFQGGEEGLEVVVGHGNRIRLRRMEKGK